MSTSIVLSHRQDETHTARWASATPPIRASTAAELTRPRPRVAAWLALRERIEAQASGGDRYAFSHCTTLASVRLLLINGQADAVLVSVGLIDARAGVELKTLVHQFPGVLFAGLVTEADRGRALIGVRMLGNAGVELLIDTTVRRGWTALREMLDGPAVLEPFIRDALATVLADLDGSTEGGRRFFQVLFSPEPGTAGDVARHIGVQSTTLMSRFARAGLPSPKRYLSLARLIWAAHFSELPGLTVAAVSARLGASSPQSFSRTLRRLLGVTGLEFRTRYNGAQMLNRFRETLIFPYRETWHRFDPVAGTVRGIQLRPTPEANEELAPCR